MDYVGEASFKEWTHSENDKGNYEFGVHVLAYIDHFNLTKEQFTEACFVVPDLPLYTVEQIDAIYGSDIEEVLKYVKNEGAIYSNGELYSAEWLNTKTAEEYLLEKIDISELKNSQAATEEAISLFTQGDARSVTSYADKIAEYETLIANF